MLGGIHEVDQALTHSIYKRPIHHILQGPQKYWPCVPRHAFTISTELVPPRGPVSRGCDPWNWQLCNHLCGSGARCLIFEACQGGYSCWVRIYPPVTIILLITGLNIAISGLGTGIIGLKSSTLWMCHIISRRCLWSVLGPSLEFNAVEMTLNSTTSMKGVIFDCWGRCLLTTRKGGRRWTRKFFTLSEYYSECSGQKL